MKRSRPPVRTPLTIVANYCFSIVSSVVLAIVAAVVTERIVEPRLGPYEPASAGGPTGISIEDEADAVQDPAAEKRGLRYALFGFLAFLGLIVLLTFPEGAPLRDPETGDIIGTTPFMDSLLFIIAMFFLIAGVAYGIGARTFKQRERRHRGGDEDVRRPGRPRLHAADDQPVHRLLQLQQHPERARDRARRMR